MSVIDEYLAELPAPERAALERIRGIVAETVPEAEEVISYGMPAFTYHGKYLVGFAPFKDHLSFFPTSAPIDLHRTELKDYKLARGTVQFTLQKPLSRQLVASLTRSRKQQIDTPR